MPSRRDFLTQTTIAGVSAALAISSASGSAGSFAEDTRTSIKTYKIPNSDLVVSRIAYGTGLGSLDWRSAEFVPKAVRVYQAAYENGINFFDLANFYQFGRSEEALGAMLQQSPGLRHRIVIQSKCGMIAREDKPLLLDLSQENIVSSTEGSLKRLCVDHLDILLLHFPDPLSEPAEIAKGLEKLEKDGKVRYFGVSNYNVTQIELLKRYVRQPLIANQIQLGIGDCVALATSGQRSVGFGGIVDYCRLHDIQVQAYSPLTLRSGGNLLNPPQDASLGVRRVCQYLGDLAKANNVGADSIALAWLLRHPAGIVPIIGSTNAEHITQNCTADHVDLTREEWGNLYESALEIQGLGWEW
jgi:predicted oxidoreductase